MLGTDAQAHIARSHQLAASDRVGLGCFDRRGGLGSNGRRRALSLIHRCLGRFKQHDRSRPVDMAAGHAIDAHSRQVHNRARRCRRVQKLKLSLLAEADAHLAIHNAMYIDSVEQALRDQFRLADAGRIDPLALRELAISADDDARRQQRAGDSRRTVSFSFILVSIIFLPAPAVVFKPLLLVFGQLAKVQQFPTIEVIRSRGQSQQRHAEQDKANRLLRRYHT